MQGTASRNGCKKERLQEGTAARNGCKEGTAAGTAARKERLQGMAARNDCKEGTATGTAARKEQLQGMVGCNMLLSWKDRSSRPGLSFSSFIVQLVSSFGSTRRVEAAHSVALLFFGHYVHRFPRDSAGIKSSAATIAVRRLVWSSQAFSRN